MWAWQSLIGEGLKDCPRFWTDWDTEAWEDLQLARGCLLQVWNSRSHSSVLLLKEMAFPSCAGGLGLEPVLPARKFTCGKPQGRRQR